MNEYRDFITPLKNPAAHYGEVPFYWWTGGELNEERLTEQLTALKENGIAGVQINYAHDYNGGENGENWGGHGASIKGNPQQFSEKWWQMFTFAAKECERLGLGIGVGDYTIAWIGNGYFTDTVAKTPGMGAEELSCEKKMVFSPEDIRITEDMLAVITYPDGDYAHPVKLYERGKENREAPYGCTECFVIRTKKIDKSVNPMAKGCGKMLTDIYFKEFERRIPALRQGTLNYFFQDELMFGCQLRYLWHEDLAKEVKKQFGYDLIGFLPHLFTVLSPLSAKIRLEAGEVKTRLIEERYFMPIYEFHASRGMIYGCDQSSRGKSPDEFSDYFQTVRWFTAPGNDTPGRAADLIKVKVNASIAHLYNRPRTWLEAYHSSGWGTTLSSITAPTSDNFIYGANLLNLHGLYYTTNGGFFEWAPPDFHFRMPYWKHEKCWLDKYKRLSAMLTTGTHRCDVAVYYPTSSFTYGENAGKCLDSTFTAAENLFAAGLDFDFIDRESLQNATVKNGCLEIAGECYRAVILCRLDAVYQSVIKKLKIFAQAGGVVVFKDLTPYISDVETVVLQREIAEILNCTQTGMVNSDSDLLNFLNKHITRSFLPDTVSQKGKVYVHGRTVNKDSLFFVRYAEKDSVCRFEALGNPYLINPYTGKIYALTGTVQRSEFTFIKMPLDATEDTLILFTDAPVEADGEIGTVGFSQPETKQVYTPDGEWDFELLPTLNNRYGDFFMPPGDMIGAEARFFDIATVTNEDEKPQQYTKRNVPFNTAFGIKKMTGDSPERLCKKYTVPGVKLPLAAEDFRMDARYGFVAHGFDGDEETQLLEQGYHGLKGKVFNDNMIFTENTAFFGQVRSVGETAYWIFSGIMPDCLYLNGKKIEDVNQPVHLQKGINRFSAGFLYDIKKAPQVRNEGKVKHAGVYLAKVKTPAVCPLPLAKADFLNDDYFPFIPFKDEDKITCLRFISVPGFKGFTGEIAGELLRAVSDKEELTITKEGQGEFGRQKVKAESKACAPHPTEVLLYIKPENGRIFTDSIVKPLTLLAGAGKVTCTDLQTLGALKNYSGEMRYQTCVKLPVLSTEEKVYLDLGTVASTAEVRINGKTAYIFTYPPFTCDITEYIREGDNTVEVTVANTLCNHYSTVPSRYSNFPKDAISGLLGPVEISVKSSLSNIY